MTEPTGHHARVYDRRDGRKVAALDAPGVTAEVRLEPGHGAEASIWARHLNEAAAEAAALRERRKRLVLPRGEFEAVRVVLSTLNGEDG